MKARNTYALPVKKGQFTGIDRSRSPAHVGKLEHAVDFGCSEGTKVLAALEGEVVWVKEDSKIGGPDKKYWEDGNRVVIKHSNEEYTAYEHLRYKSVTVKVGEKVKTGQVIGYSGNTGYSFGPHLHFEVFRLTGPDKNNDFETLEVKFSEE